MPEFSSGFHWYQRQNKVEKPVNFSGGAVFFSVLLFTWFLFACLLCLQGFGLDTDAWLMAQTAGRLRAGEGYDPARSFGNPVWEFCLAFLQPDFEFRFSNGLNLMLAILFLWRLRRMVPEISYQSYLIACCMFCLLPLFTESASSSMELMSAWYLFLECLLAIRNKHRILLLLIALLLTFTRAEFSIFLFAAVLQNRPKSLPLLIPALAALPFYIYWAYGKNPAPFQNIDEIIRFYAGRIWFLIQQAGPMLPVYAGLLFLSLSQQHPLLKWPGRFALILFLMMPFEWAYAFPAFLSGILAAAEKTENKHILWITAASLGSSLLFPHSGLPAIFLQRSRMMEQFHQAESFKPLRNTLITDGATFLPTRHSQWERSHNNRLFRKKNSLLWVGERLNKRELDSFRTAGFRICNLNRKNKSPWILDNP
jgi:hypothetical protein